MRYRTVGFVVCGALLLAACSLEPILDEDGAAPAPSVSLVELEQSEVAPPASEIADVVEEVLPSVVNVRVETAAGRGQGSGVIIERDGIILTNAHVVADAEDIEVVFNDGEREPLSAEIVGAVPDRDLAVVRVDADDLHPITLGRSSRLRLGDSVVAVGFPLGLGPTVTQGIISGEERTIETTEGRLRGLLQTDAAINPGNSGGALVNRRGELVGINTATANAAFAENTGFAIAIDSAVPLIEQILSGRQQGFMGVTLVSVDSDEAAQELGLDPDVRGALIGSDDPDQPAVVPGSPADEAGLEEGMVITAVNGVDVESADEVTGFVTSMRPGDEIELEVLTDEGTRRFSFELAARPRDILSPEE